MRINLKLKACIICSLFACAQADAQSNIPTADDKVPSVTAVAQTYGAYAQGTSINYIRTWQPQKPYQNLADVITSDRNVDEVTHVTQYVDALGRQLQTVGWQASPNKKDIVSPTVYDDYGREQYKYLPYVSPASIADGNFRNDPFTEQSVFYSTTYPTGQPAFTNEKFYYSHTDYEPSPLNRTLKSFAPGNSWAGSEGSDNEHAVQVKYLINGSADLVQIWNISSDALTYTNNDITTNIPTAAATYASGTLTKNVTIDEQGHAIVEYKDLDGQVILKKVQIGDNANIASDYSGQDANWLCTYYVYDDLGLLRFVIPPKAVAELSKPETNWQLSPTVINELCYRYEYDSRNRMVAKKVPGAGWVYMLYDKKDRLVFTQDANMRNQNEWLYTLYDVINRPVQTGILQNVSQTTLQNNLTNLTYTAPVSPSTVSGNSPSVIPAILTVTQIDPGRVTYEATQKVILNGVTLDPGIIGNITVDITSQQPVNTAISSTQMVDASPIPLGATPIPLTLTYYDNYLWTSKSYDYTNNDQGASPKLGNESPNNKYADPLPVGITAMPPGAIALNANMLSNTTGMVTGIRVRVLEGLDFTTNTWLENASFYDYKGRPVQTQGTNYKGGLDVTTLLYNFTNQVVCTYQVHNNASGGISGLAIKTNMEYDHGGRLLTVIKEINNDPASVRTISQNTYDALGQLKNRKIGQKYENGSLSSDPLEDQDYAYNIRGWLKGINWKGYGGTEATSSEVDINQNKWFGMDLSYDWGYNNNQYNGNIAGQRWKSGGDGEERSFGYGYDNANRILFADFKQKVSSGGWDNTDPAINNFRIDFSMHMGDYDAITHAFSNAYDENGNILKLQQNGLLLNTSPLIDNLTYSYAANTNKLSDVHDGMTADNKAGDFTDKNTVGDDYGYDLNGNLITDKNKRLNGNTGIDQATGGAIQYNYLNLPFKINVKNDDGIDKGAIIYIYDATGNKLEKQTTELASAANKNKEINTTTAYIGGFVYENNTLQFFAHEEGRVRRVYKDGAYAYNYDYFIKDNLGNVRTVLTDEQKTDQYPAATLEAATLATEKQLYTIPDAATTRVDETPGYPTDNTTSPNDYIQKLNGNGTKIGSSITLKVMAGDIVNIKASSWWNTITGGQQSPNPPVDILQDLLNALSTGIGNYIPLGKEGAANQLLDDGILTPGVTQFLNTDELPQEGIKPKAFLNWVLFDEHFNYVASGADAVGAQKEFKQHVLTGLTMQKNGYLYVFVSNETPNIDVFFDNLQVTYQHGPLVQDNAYSPWGLKLQGISSQALGFGGSENKYLYNGKENQSNEFSDGSGLDEYDFGARMQDPQLGVWHNIDPLTDKSRRWSPYNYTYDNPIRYTDPDGMIPNPNNDAVAAFDASIANISPGSVDLNAEKQSQIDGYANSRNDQNPSDRPDLGNDAVNAHRDELGAESVKDIFESFWSQKNISLTKDEFIDFVKYVKKNGSLTYSKKWLNKANTDKTLNGQYRIDQWDVTIDKSSNSEANVLLYYNSNKLVGLTSFVYFGPQKISQSHGDFGYDPEEYNAYAEKIREGLNYIRVYYGIYRASWDQTPRPYAPFVPGEHWEKNWTKDSFRYRDGDYYPSSNF